MSVSVSFDSHKAYWHFVQDVKRSGGNTLSAASQAFLDAVLMTAASRLRIEPANRALWRAQIAHAWREEHDGEVTFEVQCPCGLPRMIPAPEFVSAGRANRKGIAYLYAATDRETAIAEVRPWVGEYVTVAQFTNTRELRLIDFANDLRDGIRIYFKEPQPSEWEGIVWSDINSAFSRPIGRDSSAEYVPTQIIADHIRVNGFDGIVYRSSLGAGGNCCLFDLEAVMIKSRHLHHVRAVKYDAPEDGPPE